MIAALLTPAQTPGELRQAWADWTRFYGKPPAVIVVHEDLVFSCVNDPEWKQPQNKLEPDTFRGVAAITLFEFFQLHNADMGTGDAG